MQDERLIPAVNYHIWRPCNMRCKFCFATYDSLIPIHESSSISREESRELITLLASFGFRKITFSGGEPTLCPWLEDVLTHAKALGFITNVVTNGTLLTREFLTNIAWALDWLTCSIDSLRTETNISTGRAVAGRRVLQVGELVQLTQVAASKGIRIRINTVVTSMNHNEVLLPFIRAARPERWKILRYLEIAGENDQNSSLLSVTEELFNSFLANNQPVPQGTTLVPQYNDSLLGSYIMIDPLGRFIDNTRGRYRVSEPILTIGVGEALQQIKYSYTKFVARGGLYDW
jgi:radical S-adenosyl methionine domain-containing protein 2